MLCHSQTCPVLPVSQPPGVLLTTHLSPCCGSCTALETSSSPPDRPHEENEGSPAHSPPRPSLQVRPLEPSPSPAAADVPKGGAWSRAKGREATRHCQAPITYERGQRSAVSADPSGPSQHAHHPLCGPGLVPQPEETIAQLPVQPCPHTLTPTRLLSRCWSLEGCIVWLSVWSQDGFLELRGFLLNSC